MAKFSISGADDDVDEDEEGTTTTTTTTTGGGADASTSTPIHEMKRRRIESPDPQNDLQVAVEVKEEEEENERSGWSVTLTDPEVLDCSICMDPLSPPVFQCENGHIACSSCCSKLRNKCPSCSWPIGYNRCLAIEKVLESIKVSCRNRPYGCKDRVIFTQKHDHEKKCMYFPCLCPILNCEFCGSSRQLSDHFTSKHRSSSMRFGYNSHFSVSFSKLDSYLVFQGEEDGHLFLLSNEITAIGSAITVTCLGERSSNRGFSYELMSRKGDSSLRLQSQMKCVKQQDESVASASSEGFLLVPYDFYSYGKLKLEICIWELADGSHS